MIALDWKEISGLKDCSFTIVMELHCQPFISISSHTEEIISISNPVTYKMAVRWSGSRNPVEKPIEVSHQPTRLTKQVSKGTATRVRQMGPWNQQATSRQLAGPSSLPMPVEISEQTTLRPIFRDLESNGDVFPLRKEEAALARNEISLSQAQEAYCI